MRRSIAQWAGMSSHSPTGMQCTNQQSLTVDRILRWHLPCVLVRFLSTAVLVCDWQVSFPLSTSPNAGEYDQTPQASNLELCI